MNPSPSRQALLALCAVCVSCASLESAEQSVVVRDPSVPWVWPEQFDEVKRADVFNAGAVIDLVNARDKSGAYKYTRLQPLLETPLFADSGPKPEGEVMYMTHTRGLFDNRPAGPVAASTPRSMAAIGTTVVTAQNRPGHSESFDRMEMIAADAKTMEIDFYLFDLAATDPAQRVQKNPDACVHCHDGRYVWGMYPYWPGSATNSKQFAGLPRYWGHADPIGFSLSLWDMNMARIAKSLLENPKFYPVEAAVIAAVLDCPEELFTFTSGQDYAELRADFAELYYAETIDLIEDVKKFGGHNRNVKYRYDEQGKLHTGIVLNERDPIRLSLLTRLLENTDVDISTWSISRRPMETGHLFQTSGGLSLSRLGFYLVENSPNAARLRETVPNIGRLSYNEEIDPDFTMCEVLTEGLR